VTHLPQFTRCHARFLLPFLPACLRTLRINPNTCLSAPCIICLTPMSTVSPPYLSSFPWSACLSIASDVSIGREKLDSLTFSLSTLASNSRTDSVHQLRVEQQRHSGCRYRSPRDRERERERERDSQTYHTTRTVLGKLNYGASSPESHHCVTYCSSSVPSAHTPPGPPPPPNTHYRSNSMGPDPPLFCAYALVLLSDL
jgi:hypothetical protein